MLKKCLEDIVRSDMMKLIFQFIQKHSPNDKKTHHVLDHKKILKIFFKWIKINSREYIDVRNPSKTILSSGV